MSGRPLVLTPRAARWLHMLVHEPRIGVMVPDLQAAAEAVGALDAYVAKLPPPPTPPAPPGASPDVAALLNGARR